MVLQRRKGLFESTRVLFLPITSITPNPNQPRHTFCPDSLEELAASIRLYGILQPLSVRKIPGGYELISGERRLRAAKLAGLSEVPCILVQADDQSSSLLALIENLQRRDLDFVEEAAALAKLIRTFDLSQEEAARRIGKSQSAVANKLRLLKLSPALLERLRSAGLTERHARALLRLEDEPARSAALDHIIAAGLTVAQTEAYIDSLRRPAPKKRKPTYLIRDVRLFLNTVSRAMQVMQGAGIPAQCDRQDTDDAVLLTIRIPK